MKFDSLKPDGTNLYVRDWPSADPTGDNPPGGSNVFAVHAGSNEGLRYNLLDGISGGLSNPLGWHTYRLEYAGGAYSVLIDGNLVEGPVVSSRRPNDIWLGNPVFTHWANEDWTDFTIDYIHVDTDVTPPAPPATGVFDDEFGGSALDPTLWNTSIATGNTRWCADSSSTQFGGPGNWQDTTTTPCNGLTQAAPYGAINVTGGLASFSSGVKRGFPYVWSGAPSRSSFFAGPDFAASGDFSFETRVRFDSLQGNGSFLRVLNWPNTDPVGGNHPAAGSGVFGLGGAGTITTSLLSSQGPAVSNPGAFHTYRLDYTGGQYSVFVDGVRVQGPVASTLRPNAIWIGNPNFTYWTLGDWTDFTVDYMRLTFPPARPKGGSPTQVSLVPAFNECLEPNTLHGAALDFPSCNPPAAASAYATIGTPDVNGNGSKMLGQIRLGVLGGTSPDVTFGATISDVRSAGDLADYGGQLEGRLDLRITDRNNGASGTESATMVDTPMPFPIDCTPTTDTTIGSACAANTSANAIDPGSVVSGKRAIWQLGEVRVFDGGADGSAATHGDNTLYLRQGVFVP
jgi:hypothetical protein